MAKIPNDRRCQAVLAVLAGRPWSEVTSTFGISRARLATLCRRALDAIATAVDDTPRARAPVNRTRPEFQEDVEGLARRHPTWPAHRIAEMAGVRPRTVQRIRLRCGLPKLPKRAPRRYRRRHVPAYVRRALVRLRKRQPYLGPRRLAWELKNTEGILVSPSWIRDWLRPDVIVGPPTPRVWRRYERHHAHMDSLRREAPGASRGLEGSAAARR